MFYILFSDIKNYEIFDMWINHYSNKLKINWKIYVKNDGELYKFLEKYNNYSNKVITSIPENGVLLTENDFLFKYSVDEKDTMILSYNVDDKILDKSFIIGKIFSVLSIDNRYKYTTFEIPDFIIYKHLDHTNYSVDGVKINHGSEASESLVFLNLSKSKVSYEKEYYHTNILFNNEQSSTFNNIYHKFSHNIYVNKEKKYAIIWHPKCGCSIIRSYFCHINNLKDAFELPRKYHKYRYNNYLQNIEIISFVRNPYFRFISCYLNKHVDKCDHNYLNFENYKEYLKIYKKDTLLNFANYSKTKKIDEHSDRIVDFYYNNYNLTYKIFHIEDGIVYALKDFFKKYHENFDSFKMLVVNDTKKNDTSFLTNNIFKNYDVDDWLIHKSKNNCFPNYYDILDEELKSIIYEIYKDDFKKLNYDSKINCSYKNADIDKFLILFDKEFPNFNFKKYIELYRDLSSKNEYEAKVHYYYNGQYEGRVYK